MLRPRLAAVDAPAAPAHDSAAALRIAAYDLHDGPAQKLLWARNHAQALARAGGGSPSQLELLRDVLADAVCELQDTIGRLSGSAPAAAAAPLSDRVRCEAELLRARSDAAIELELPAALPALSPVAADAAFRLVQEALANALAHGAASRVHVAVELRAGSLLVTVTDDGAGFDVAAALERPPVDGHGFGLAGMRERMLHAGGQLWLSSRPGAGTCVRAELPLGSESRATA